MKVASTIRSRSPVLKRPGLGWLLLAGVKLIALWVRLDSLGSSTMTYPEFQVGRLEFPDYVVQPGPRRTLVELEKSVMAPIEIHPPGYCFLSWL